MDEVTERVHGLMVEHFAGRAREAIELAGGLVGRPELREAWGVSKQRVEQITANPNFPDAVGASGRSLVWLKDEVEAWRKDRNGRSVLSR